VPNEIIDSPCSTTYLSVVVDFRGQNRGYLARRVFFFFFVRLYSNVHARTLFEVSTYITCSYTALVIVNYTNPKDI